MKNSDNKNDEEVLLLKNQIKELEKVQKVLEDQNKQLSFLNDLGKSINLPLSLDDVIRKSLERLNELINPDLIYFFMKDGDKLNLVQSEPPHLTEIIGTVPEHKVGEGLCGLAALEKNAVYSSNIHCDARCTMKECKEAGIKSFAAIPLIYENKIVGVIGLASQKETDFSMQSSFFETIASQISTALSRVEIHSQLNESEERLHTVLDAAPFPIGVADLQDESILFWSRSAIDLFGHPAPANTLQWYEMAYPDPDYRHEVIERWKPFLDTARQSLQVVNTGEYEVTCSDGSVLICELYVKILSDFLIVTFNDITKRKQAEEKIRFHANLLDIIGQAVIATDNNGKVTYWNHFAENLYGLPADKAIGKNIMELTVSETTKEQAAEIMAGLQKGESWTGEFLVRRQDGTHFPALVNNVPIIDEQGKLDGIIGVSIDITDRKKAEADIEKLKNFLNYTINALAESVVLMEENGQIILVNKAWQEFAKNNGADLESVSVGANYFAVCKNESGEWIDEVKSFANGLFKVLSGELNSYTFEYPCHSPYEQRWFIATITLYSSESTRYIVIAHENITEIKKAEENLRRIEWLLTKTVTSTNRENQSSGNNYIPTYGDLLKLNTSRTILDSVSKDILTEIAGDYLDLLDSSAAIYERNGDYASGLFSSGWCQYLDQASFNLCNTSDPAEALASGKWLCHESCWSHASKVSMQSGKPVDIECHGGIRLYAIPVFAYGEIVGSINFGHGDPPRDPDKLKEISERYNVNFDELAERAKAYETRPPYIIELAKKRLQSSARLIGEIVERKHAEEILEQQNQKLSFLYDLSRVINSTLSPSQVIRIALERINLMVQPYVSFFFLRQAEELVLQLVEPKDSSGIFSGVGNHKVGECMCGLAVTQNQALYSKDIFTDMRCTWDECKEAGLKSFAALPLRHEGDVIGVIGISSKKERDFEQESEYLEIISDQISTALTKSKIYEKLKESEEKYRDLVEKADIAVLIDEEEGKIIYFNEKLADLFDYNIDEMKDRSIQSLVHPDDVDCVIQIHKGRYKGYKSPSRYEFKGIKKDGTEINLEVDTVEIIEDEEITGTRSYLWDITERKIAEEVLKKRNKELEIFNDIAVGRELRMIELKKEINSILEKLGKAPKYEIPV